MNTQNNTKPFGIKDKFGYMMGDVANDFMFIFAAGYLMVFYTKVLGVDPKLVGTLFLVSRLIDAVTDIGMGVIVDRMTPAKDGRFRSWIRRMAIPVALASFLMYQTSLADASDTVKVIYMFATYLLWGSVCYTGINIPYGSMAASISADPKDRAALSTWRSVGAQLAVTLINVITPMLIYHKNADGNQVVNKDMFPKLAGIFSICAVICYVICYQCTTERVQVVPQKKKAEMGIVQTLFSSKALFALILAAITLVFGGIFANSFNPYLFADYFNDPKAFSLFNFGMLFVSLGLSAVIVPLSMKVGKKETAIIGTAFTGIIYLVLFVLKVKNPLIYVGATLVANAGQLYFQMAVWAFLTDVLDDSEVRTNKRDDGAIYGVYSFARKVGQAIAGFVGGYALSAIGYVKEAEVQTEAVKQGLYSVATVGQGVAYIIVAIVLFALYPLSKNKIASNVKTLQERRANNAN